MFVLAGEVHVTRRFRVVHIGLVKDHERLGCCFDDPAHVGLGHPRSRRAVWVGDEYDSGVVVDGLDVRVDIERHRGPVGGLVGENRHTALGFGEQVVKRKARSGHQDFAAGFTECADDQR